MELPIYSLNILIMLSNMYQNMHTGLHTTQLHLLNERTLK